MNDIIVLTSNFLEVIVMTEWTMDGNITIKLDSGRDDANREGAHCNVYKRGNGRVGRLEVDKYGSVSWTSYPGGNINRNQMNEIERFVRSIAWEILHEYDKIRNG